MDAAAAGRQRQRGEASSDAAGWRTTDRKGGPGVKAGVRSLPVLRVRGSGGHEGSAGNALDVHRATPCPARLGRSDIVGLGH